MPLTSAPVTTIVGWMSYTSDPSSTVTVTSGGVVSTVSGVIGETIDVAPPAVAVAVSRATPSARAAVVYDQFPDPSAVAVPSSTGAAPAAP